jgi:hypothetical protein
MTKMAVFYLVAVLAVGSLTAIASAKKVEKTPLQFQSIPRADAPLPPDLASRYGGALRSATVTDTFVLHEEDFDGPGGQPDTGGYTTVDRTDQLEAFWHVADGTELDGGTFGTLLPIDGAQSMWCGKDATTAVPYCGYFSLPGYGDGWDQTLISNSIGGDSVSITYDVQWDSEGGYDGTRVEYTFDGGSTWLAFPVTDTLSARAGLYDNTGSLTETFAAGSPGASNVQIRFRFQSDGAWSDEDGLWPTDGAVMVDNITINTWSGGAAVFGDTENFEAATPGSNTAGIWTGVKAPAYGDFADLYPAVSLLQEDPCQLVFGFVWGFFDDPLSTNYNCHTPDPRPDVGAMPYGTPEGIYMSNEIWSPVFANSGSGLEYRLIFSTYVDMPLDNLQFWVWHVRSWSDPDGAGPLPLCPGTWRDDNFVYFGGFRTWVTAPFQAGPIVDATADALQVAVGAVDMCAVWCNYYGSGACHSHAPLIDEVRVERIAVFGPQFTVRHLELFQDNFAELVAQPETGVGKAPADAAVDILPSTSPGIVPGDSVTMTIAPLAVDPNTGVGPAAYAYVRVENSNAPKAANAALGSSQGRARIAGNRWPFIATQNIAGTDWAVFRMDSAITTAGAAVADRYCIDLNDNLFEPGDTVHYFFGADVDGTPSNSNENYWHRIVGGQGGGNVTPDITEAATSPCEMTILPAGGLNRGGDILYVDDNDPAWPGVIGDQIFFDSAFDMLGIRDLIDRYDVLGPSSAVGNSLASRVKDDITQIIDNYRKVIWNTGNRSAATVGDGTGNPEKSDDWGLLFQFLNTSTLGPGLYLSGDNLAEEWVTLTGAGAIQTRSVYMNFNLLNGDHVTHGEAVSPTLTATGASFTHLFVPDVLVVYGGCAVINDFDVLSPTGGAFTDFPYPNSGDGAVISQQTLNAAAQTATVVLSGFSYGYIRDAFVNFPPARVEHLRDILIKMGNVVPEATGVDPGMGPQYANSLFNNYPNPFNPTTTIRYTIKNRWHVSLKIYNAAGQLVRTLIDEVHAPDEVKPVEWDGRNNAGQSVSSGVYFYKLVTKNFSQTKKMVLLK